MKLIKVLRNLEARFHTTRQSNDIFHLSALPLIALSISAALIWFAGPLLRWEDFAPLASAEKRGYIISFLFLIWLLKFLLLDLEAPNPHQYKDAKVRKKLLELQNRFRGAIKFINTATTTKNGHTVGLTKLPLYLLIGPADAGKTSLLANADVHYILQRHFPHHDVESLKPSEHFDWWVTREASIIDVPGKYVSTHPADKNTKLNLLSWQFFLRLIKKQRGKNGIDGIIIALPASDIMKPSDIKQYQLLIKTIFQKMREVQAYFPHALHCQIILTKCDSIPGFSEFFAESSNEEIAQAWGVNLSPSKTNEKMSHLFSSRFDALIKKINQQLLWRLHQERNPMLRPPIKDFPLQVERMKEGLLNLINQLSSSHLNLSLQGIYLTSALQAEVEENILDHAMHSNIREIQIFKAPRRASRAFFIKQFIMHGLCRNPIETAPIATSMHWLRRSVYAFSVSCITLTIVLLGLDFQRGIEQTQLIKTHLATYQTNIANTQSSNEHLLETIHLLNNLKPKGKEIHHKTILHNIFSFYSQRSQQKARELYYQALHAILVLEIKSYFENYLNVPVNKNAEDIYATLKAYLMLGDATYFNPEYINTIFTKILPSSVQTNEKNDLNTHLNLAFHTTWNPMKLDEQKILDTRRYLLSLPSSRLSYIILKNIDNNNSASPILFPTSLAFSTTHSHQVPTMFTAQSYQSIITQESMLAAQEAMTGNWVLGRSNIDINNTIKEAASLTQQLRDTYIKQYIDTWEKFLESIHLSSANNLEQVDATIASLINNDSPLLHLLKTLRENTYFNPIASASPKLQNLNLLIDNNPESQALLYEIFSSLQSLHLSLQSVIKSDNQRLAAFQLVSSRMLNHGELDAITQLRMVAEKSPKPIKTWLDKIADDSWQFLMQDAGHYLDTSWQNKVMHHYQTNIADRYPFNKSHQREVNLQDFTRFFGNPGILISYFNQYLQNFVDTSTSDWHWKKIDGKSLPFSEETLRQIQQAMRIHQSFFPKNDNQLLVQFTIQPYEFDDSIKTVTLSVDNKQFIDDQNNFNTPHTFTWPTTNSNKMTSVQLTMANENTIHNNYPGDWGWFKLLNQSYESMLTKKEILLNLSLNEHPAKYILAADGKHNPLGLNLSHFRLPQQLTEERA